jgi:hypothetical protein
MPKAVGRAPVAVAIEFEAERLTRNDLGIFYRVISMR